MRRFLLAGLVIAAACSSSGDTTVTDFVGSVLISSNAPLSGVFVGDQVQMNATPVDASDNPVPTPITYSSSNTKVATITAGGLISAVGAGTSTMTATAGGIEGAWVLTVDGNVTGSLVVTPSTAAIKVGAQQQFSFAVSTTLGNPARGKSVTWSSSAAADASVNTTGNATGIAPINGAQICAAATDVPTVVGCGALTVTP